MNLTSGDATIFQTHGQSSGLGLSAGPGMGLQHGSFNDLVAKSGSGGGRSANGATPLMTGAVNFDDARRPTGGGLGTAGAGFAINSTANGNTLGTVNLYAPLAAAARRTTDAIRLFRSDAARALLCPNGCREVP